MLSGLVICAAKVMCVTMVRCVASFECVSKTSQSIGEIIFEVGLCVPLVSVQKRLPFIRSCSPLNSEVIGPLKYGLI